MGFIFYLFKLISRTWLVTAGILEFLLYIWALNNQINLPPAWYLVLPLISFPVAAYQVHQEQVKQIAQAKEENAGLTNAQPDLIVGFLPNGTHNGQSELELVFVQTAQPDYSDLVLKKRKELITRFEKITSERDEYDGTEYQKLSIVFGLRSINPNYVSEVDEYLKEYRDYLEKAYNYNICRSHLKLIRLVVLNNGRVLATDVEIQLDFPFPLRLADDDEMEWLEPFDELLEDVRKPRLPKEPDFYQDRLSLLTASMPFDFRDLSTPFVSTPGPFSYTREPEKTKVKYSFSKIVPDLPIEIGPLGFWFNDLDKTTILEIPVRIYAAQLPKALAHHLLAKVTIQAAN